jgi:hypothetical protein
MVNRNLLRQYDLSDAELDNELAEAFSRPETGGDVENWLLDDQQEFESNKVIKGRIARIEGDDVVIAPSLQDPDIIKQKFPKGYTAVTPYLRLTPQPQDTVR